MPFAPSDITGLLNYYENDTVSGTDGGAYAPWVDRSGAAKDMSSANPPAIFNTTGPNSTKCLTFDGVNDNYANATMTGATGVMTWVVVVKVNTSGTASRGRVFDTTTNRNLLDVLSSTTGKVTVYNANTGASVSQAATIDVRGAWKVITCLFGPNNKVYVNGLLDYAETGGSGGDTPGATWRMGTDGFSGAWLDGSIAALYIYNKNLDATERANLHTYISDRTAITVSDYVGGTTPTASDTATGTDTSTLATALASADTAAAANVATLATALTSGDTAVAVDAASVVTGTAVAATDAGTGTDTASVAVAVAAAQPVTATDLAALAAAVAGADLAAVVDAATAAGVVVTTAGRMTATATAGPSMTATTTPGPSMTRRELAGATMTGGQV